MEELIQAISKAVADEDKGVQEYEEMAEAFMQHGHDEYAQILRDMAAEEATHAKHLHNILAEVAKK